MSKSKRKPYIKDAGDNEYNKRIRRVQKHDLRNAKDLDNVEIRNGKLIINDYDVCDYRIKDETNVKLTRK